ncbi:response regulator [Desulfonema magnum]|uniref:histidine kinase n=1 Tax=Desulfonema magnum TaxID=45655 RepID=A0A975BS86_9BACT|nr:response regulator [Desulfonema magnum]QTA90264.1 Two component system response regulator/histidine kinase, HAMP domain-containing [Desulfonema magnum]
MKFSIMFKLVLIFVAIIIVPMAVITLINMRISADRIERELQEAGVQALKNAKIIMTEHAKHAKNIATLLAKTGEIKEKLTDKKRQAEIQSDIDVRQDLFLTAIVEVFNSKKQLLGRTYTGESSAKKFFTDSQDPIVSETLELEKQSDYVVASEGLAFKASCPVVDYQSLRPVGAVIVTNPLNAQFFQVIKGWIQAEVTFIFIPRSDPGKRNCCRIVSTLRDQSGEPLTQLWGDGSDFELLWKGLEFLPVQRQENIGSHFYTTTYASLRNREDQIVGILSTAMTSDGIEQGREDAFRMIMFSSLMGFILAIIAGTLTARIFTRPICQVVTAIRTLTRGNSDARIYLKQKDEIGELAEAFNEMEEHLRKNTEQKNIPGIAGKGTDFLASMSHKVRTPMGAIMGLADLALKTDLTERQRDYLNKIGISARVLFGVINDILDFSKIEAGKLELEPERFDLNDVLEDLSEIFSGKAAEKEIEIIISIAKDVPSALMGDSQRLGQILINLTENALKFTNKGEIVIKAERVTGYEAWVTTQRKEVKSSICNLQPDNQVMLRFSVGDTGIGIPHEQLRSLFSPFTQHDDVTQKYGGIKSLGLIICKHLVKMMGGDIWAESKPGKGSIFYFTANFEVRSQADTGKRKPLEKFPGKKAQHRKNKVINKFKGARVLLVEDNTINQQIATEILERAGIIVKIANNGKDAIEAVSRCSYDAVLMDLEMPEKNGLEATKIIRSSGDKTPVIAMTAHAMKSDREKCFQAGMNDYVTKPIDVVQLFSTLARWIKPEAGNLKLETGNQKPETHDSCFQFPYSLPGIDIKSGLERLGGNKKLFRELLIKFLENYMNAADDIRSSLKKGDVTSALKLTHSLKGIAGNISAKDLHEASKELELEIRHGNREFIFFKLDAFENALTRVLESIRRISSSESADRK